MSTDPEIHPRAESDTTVLGETIDYLQHLHERMADRIVRVTTRDSDITASLPKRLKALQKTLADQSLKAAQDNARD